MNLGFCFTLALLLGLCEYGYAQVNFTMADIVFIQMLTLHGSTSPTFLYPNDPNPESLWEEGLGDLTMVGKFRSYAAGYNMRLPFYHFITTNPTEVEVFSHGDRACVKTSQSFVSAMYQPNKYWEVVQDFPWQPIYIAYENEQTDKYLSKPKCLAADNAYQKLLLEESQKIMPKYENLIKLWKLGSGMELKNLHDIQRLHDTIKTEALYNLTVPDWALHYWNELEELSTISRRLTVKPRIVQRLRGGPLLGLIVDKMKQKALNETNKKIVVYTTHECKMTAVMSALGIYQGQSMPENTNLMFIMYEKNGGHFVRHLLLNSTSPDRQPMPHYDLKLPGCDVLCPLDYIIHATKDMIPEDWEEECQNIQ